MRPSRVLLVDDHPVVLQGIGQMLRSTDTFWVVGEATSADAAIEIGAREQPDLVVLDLRVGDTLAPEICANLRAVAPGTKVVILTAFDDEILLRACVRAGAVGVLLKDMHGLDVLGALKRVSEGQVVVDERIRITDPPSAADEQPSNCETTLTRRELQILRLLPRGLTSKEMAEELGLTQNTVRGYTQSVLTKLHVTNRVQALVAAQRLHLI
jgi:two-component system, NarL family, nitrate/nitrite response regulator NarL